jgi:outer membrane immunogenic protein
LLTKLKLAGLAAAAVIAGAGAADAADISYTPPPAPVVVPPAPAPLSWSGIYVGLNAGWAWGEGDAAYAGDPLLPPDAAPAIGLDPSGGLIGGTVGYNMQFGSGLVLGIEGDYDYAKLHDDGDAGFAPYATHVDLDVDQLASIRGRVGWSMGNWMPYLTAGWAWAHAERDIFNPALTPSSYSVDNWHDGWVAGAGVEVAFDSNWSAKLEYTYADLGEENYNVPTLGGEGTDVDLNVQTVKFGINYKFGGLFQ